MPLLLKRPTTALLFLLTISFYSQGRSSSPQSGVSDFKLFAQSRALNASFGVDRTTQQFRDRTSVLEWILAEDYDYLDPDVLKASIESLKSRGAHRCWHKHSTFLQHLLGVHNILRCWGQGRDVGRLGLFHSAYSNSYVNLALYDPNYERSIMRGLIGEVAEEWVFLFCIINRQEVVVNTLLHQGYIPEQGLNVPHLRDPNQQVYLSAETLRMLVVFTMADIADQYFGWQDDLFGGGGDQGSMIIPGQDHLERHNSMALWPGVSKPGLWMSYVSDLAAIVRTAPQSSKLPAPPVFGYGRQRLTVDDEREARDLYWAVVTGDVNGHADVMVALKACTDKNRWAFEPWVLLAQVLLHQNQFDAALEAARRALTLQGDWGTAWDKRLSFGAWVAWARVLHQRAEDRVEWSVNSWHVNNLGLVR